MTARFPRVFARGAVRRVSYAVIGTVAALARVHRKRAWTEDRTNSILICRLDLMGDVLFTRPLVTALKSQFPHASITLLTLPYTAALAQLYPEVDEVVTVDTNRIRTVRGLVSPGTWREYRSTARRLRSRQFDLGVSVCGRMASLCIYLAGPKRSVGYEREAYPFLLDRLLAGGRYGTRKHEVEYSRALAAFAGAADSPRRLMLEAPTASVTRVGHRLVNLGVTPADRLLVIHAGAVNGSAKRWPPMYWARFAERIAGRVPVKIVLIGARSDLPLADQVASLCRVPTQSLVGQTTTEELIAVLARANLVATGDSGPLHLAVALGRPLVAPYGPTDPRVHGPYNPTAPVRIFRADIPCSPCYSMAATAECPLGDPICMRLVTVDQMVAGALELLGAGTDELPVREHELLVSQQDALQNAE